jgi:hypothetical protein
MEKFTPFIITNLSSDWALDNARKLPTEGLLKRCHNYCYLKIDDNYIHSIYPLLDTYGHINKPDYFNTTDDIGAHISVIYPEENIDIAQIDSRQTYCFSIDGLIKARYGVKDYFALAVTSPSLAIFRQKHLLASKPTFKRQPIVFHITIGVRDNNCM